jgi:hypothetical protein
MDLSGFGSVRIWITQDLDPSRFRSVRIRICQDSDLSGSDRLGICQYLDQSRFGSVRIQRIPGVPYTLGKFDRIASAFYENVG